MKANRIIQAITLFALTFAVACTSNNEEDLPKPSSSSCDTAGMNYQDEVRSIFSKHSCLACHNSRGASGQVNLDEYEEAKKSANLLLPSLRHDPQLPTRKHMPRGAPNPIPDCEIRKIEAWINAGLPE